MVDARCTLSATLVLGLFFSSLITQAQQVERVRRIGYLAAPTPSPVNVELFHQGLRERGYVEGRNLLIEWRSAQGQDERLPGLATDLVRLKVEVIVTEGPSAALAAKNATASIPIVMAIISDPVALGLVASLARPGGNITGVAALTVELTGKRIELLKEAIPPLKSVALLTNPVNPGSALSIKEAQIAARRLGLGVRVVEVHHPTELEPAFTSIAGERTMAVALVPGSWLFMYRMQIAEFAIKRGLPVIGWQRRWVESGALMSYGPNPLEMLQRAASHVDKILKGAKPADLPVEQPTKVELVLNVKTSKMLGLTIPRSLLLRADHIIE